MATLSKPVGYECDFADQVPEDYLCELCNHVAREPTIASCCTKVLCKACIDAVIQDKKPCPSCKSINIGSQGPQKKYQAEILGLNVHCMKKDHGCEWIGQLQHLNAHLHDCGYANVQCEHCNQVVQKRNMDTHLIKECNFIARMYERMAAVEQELREKERRLNNLQQAMDKRSNTKWILKWGAIASITVVGVICIGYIGYKVRQLFNEIGNLNGRLNWLDGRLDKFVTDNGRDIGNLNERHFNDIGNLDKRVKRLEEFRGISAKLSEMWYGKKN